MGNIYKLELKPQGYWITPLQADTIWGHICWQIKWSMGDEAVKDFIKPFADGKPPFVLSNGLPHNWLPRPITDMDFEIEDLEKAKKWKKVMYIKTDTFNKYGEYLLDKKKYFDMVDDYINNKNYILDQKFEEVSISKNSINRNNLSTDDTFILDGKVNNYSLNVYFNIFDDKFLEKFKIIEIKDGQYFSGEILQKIFYAYGKKKSTGFGCFEVKGFSSIKFNDNVNGLVSISNFIFDKEIFENEMGNLYFESFVKYPTYGETKSIQNGDGFLKSPINFIKSGMSYKTDKNIEYLGTMLDLGNGIYQYGYGFLLNY